MEARWRSLCDATFCIVWRAHLLRSALSSKALSLYKLNGHFSTDFSSEENTENDRKELLKKLRVLRCSSLGVAWPRSRLSRSLALEKTLDEKTKAAAFVRTAIRCCYLADMRRSGSMRRSNLYLQPRAVVSLHFKGEPLTDNRRADQPS